jgi:hypothetical protein
VPGERASAPVKDRVGDFGCGHVGGVDGVHAPVWGELFQAMPAHFLPAAVGYDVRHVEWVACLSAHPLRKRLVMRQKLWRVATRRETFCLRFGAGVQQTYRDRVELCCRWRGDKLDCWHRITRQQQVSSGRLQLDGTTYGRLRCLLAPDPRHRQRPLAEMQELEALNRRRELTRNERPDGGFADAAGAGYQQQHARDYCKPSHALPTLQHVPAEQRLAGRAKQVRRQRG